MTFLQKIDAWSDWAVLITCPLAAWNLYMTGSVGLLRFLALWWLLNVFTRCAFDRARAHELEKLRKSTLNRVRA